MKEKKYNIELLRIVSMFFIVVTHAHFFTFGRPEGHSLQDFLSCALASVINVGVNCFTLITGYFGTKFNLRKIVSLVFQCCFCVIPIALVCLYVGVIQIEDINSIITNFWPLGYWYVVAYIGMLIFVPVLNAFIDSVGYKKLGTFIIAFYIFVLVFDVCLRDNSSGVMGGYSVLWLMFMYCVGRYVGHINWTSVKTKSIILIFALCVAIKTCLCVFHINGYRYTNPTIVIASVCFFLLFLRIKVSNLLVGRIITFFSTSTLMVYLLNLQPQVMPQFRRILYYMHSNFSASSFVVASALFCVIFFCVAVLYDKLRILIWGSMEKWLQLPEKNK